MRIVPEKIRIQIITAETPYELSVRTEVFCREHPIREVYDIKYQHSMREVCGNDSGICSEDLYSAMIIFEEE